MTNSDSLSVGVQSVATVLLPASLFPPPWSVIHMPEHERRPTGKSVPSTRFKDPSPAPAEPCGSTDHIASVPMLANPSHA